MHKKNQFSELLIGKFFKLLAIAGLIIYIFYILLSNHPCCYSSTIFNNYSTHLSLGRRHYTRTISNATYISHIVFGITSSIKSWNNKKWYVESWWRPNMTRGYVYLDGSPRGPWSESLPPFRISEDTSRYKQYDKHHLRHAIRMTRVIVEVFREEKSKGTNPRWFVLADEDTVFFVENLVRVLGKYDHEKYFYIGMNSECHFSNWFFSYEMAFGGGGFAFSYPLAEAVVNTMDICLQKYPTLFGSDHIFQACVADLGVSLTQEKGFHQMDLHGDISGLLSAHPHTPLVTLHHLDHMEPIFPGMNRPVALSRIMKAAELDQSRLLQQSVCHHRPKNWTFSVSWGYSVHIYESIVHLSVLQKPLQTFGPWSKYVKPFFMFNTRVFDPRNPCQNPHVFFFDSVERSEGRIVTRFARRERRVLPPCAGGLSAAGVPEIRVVSPLSEMDWVGSRRECCEVIHADERNATEIRITECGIKDGSIVP